jgi:hypothetical protein
MHTTMDYNHVDLTSSSKHAPHKYIDDRGPIIDYLQWILNILEHLIYKIQNNISFIKVYCAAYVGKCLHFEYIVKK